jgi:hypothetical protein
MAILPDLPSKYSQGKAEANSSSKKNERQLSSLMPADGMIATTENGLRHVPVGSSTIRLPQSHGRTTWALQQVGNYLGYTGRGAGVVVTAAHDPLPELGVLRKCEVTGTRRLTQL